MASRELGAGIKLASFVFLQEIFYLYREDMSERETSLLLKTKKYNNLVHNLKKKFKSHNIRSYCNISPISLVPSYKVRVLRKDF